jgi:polysaccharide biosynthesis/export protein
MRVRRVQFFWTTVASCVAFLFPVASVFGQATSTSNPLSDIEQQVLQGLTPDQRSQIMNQLGIGGGAPSDQQGNGRNRSDQQNPLDQGQRPLSAVQQAEQERLSPYLAGDDWLVITVDSRPLPALPANPLQQTPGVLSAGGLPPGVLANLPPNVSLPGAATAASGTQRQALDAAASAGTSTSPVTATAGGYAPGGAAPDSRGGSTNANAQPELSQEQQARRKVLIDLIRTGNPYQLSHDGTLALPGFAPIALAGLTEPLAALRIGSEPALRELFIRVTKLPLRKAGTTALKPFGYELFERPISTFAPVTNVPVPSAYIVGPGDQLEVQLYGSENRILYLVVGRDGRLQFPGLGPVSVAGQTFDAARAMIEGRVARQMIGVHASVSMGDTRSIRVFVLGEAKQPGSYTISGLGTITSALFAAGGARTTGSLRNVQLKRQGALIRQFDLYDMLIRGDTTDDAKLLSGDVVFIPAVGPTVAVDGEVRRPAIYEMRGETSIESLVRIAGGLTPEADPQRAALTRIDAQQKRVVLQVDLAGPGQAKQMVRDGDALRIPRLRPTIDAGVQVSGYVFSAGLFAYHDGMRLTGVIRSADDLRPNADQHYLLIRRELPPDRRVVVLSADLDAALRAPGSADDVVLMPRDRITVFDLQSSRDRVIQPLLDDLRVQSSSERPMAVVRVDGRVNVPGEYPLEQNMTVRDLVRAGGSLSDAAYSGKAEVTRYTIENGESRRTVLIPIDLAAAMRGDPQANIRLQAYDTLSIKEVQAWGEQESVTLGGEVKFPGRYSITRGESLKSVVMRAGGLTDLAFPEGAVFTRKELREREQKQLDMLADRMQSDIAFLALQGANSNQASAATGALAVGQSLLDQLRSTKAVGRLVINLKAALGNSVGSRYDVALRGGDQLLVPKYQQEVSVIGEVQIATSHLYRPGLGRADYIALSGGETRRADGDHVYVVRADGSVVANVGSRWFMHDPGVIKPGDTVVVPLNAEHIPALPFWQSVTQIIYNVAIAAAAVHSF